MSDRNPNKIMPEARGIAQVANLFGCALDTVSDIPLPILNADDAVSMTTERIYKRDSLFMALFVFEQLHNLLDCLRSCSECFL